MRYTDREGVWNTAPSMDGAIPPAIKMLLIANGVMFLLQMMANSALVRYLGLTPAMVTGGAVWQIFTYMFLHGGFMHILFNMFGLWMFGRDIEQAWGSREFLKYYLICGVGAGLVTVAALWGSNVPTIGASGAVYGILLAYGMLFPNRLVYLMFVIPIPAKYFVVLFGLLELVSSLQYSSDGIGHFTHLGGLAIGFLYLRWGGRRIRFPRPLAFLGRWRARRKAKALKQKWDDQRALMEAVDRVLDRINEVGYDQLTSDEKETLERASRKLSTEKSQS
ncbi:MAG: rhomboid family intramembrane serine protease [Candidatus Zixiibacteriota bacterium]